MPAAIKKGTRQLLRQKDKNTQKNPQKLLKKVFSHCNKTRCSPVIKAEGQKHSKEPAKTFEKNFSPDAIKQGARQLLGQKGKQLPSKTKNRKIFQHILY